MQPITHITELEIILLERLENGVIHTHGVMGVMLVQEYYT